VNRPAVGFLGIGVALPTHVRTNAFWGDRLAARREAHKRDDILAIQHGTDGRPVDVPAGTAAAMAARGDDPFGGSKLRHVIDDAEMASDLEARAARAAMADAGVTPEAIDLVLVASLPPDRLVPSNAPAVQDKCGLVNASAWSLDVGCASTQPQLLTAAALIATGAAKHVLIVQSQIGSRTVDQESHHAPGFGDAAAAAVVGAVPDGYGLLGSHLRTDGSLRDGVVLAPSRDGKPLREWWEAGGGPPRLATFDADAGKQAGIKGPEFCRVTCRDALKAAGIRLDEVSLFLCNQSVSWFADACRRALELPEDRLVETYEEVGNIGGAAILFNLHRAREQGRLKRGDTLLLYSPGAGFTRAAAVVRWWGTE
jgi:3-oxoacyl-[acyl-carrier-protein] synthase-3